MNSKIVALLCSLLFAVSTFAQKEINQLDSLGRKTGHWEFVPDSVDMFWTYDRIAPNNGKGLHLFYLSDSLDGKLKDTIVTVRANYRKGKMQGKVCYYIDNKYPIVVANYARGEPNGIVQIYGGHFYDLFMILTYSNGIQEGFEMFFNGSSIETEFYVNGEHMFDAGFSFGRASFLPYKNNKVKNGTYFFPRDDGAYWKVKYRGGKEVKQDYLFPGESNLIKDYTKKGGERVYYWGRISDFFNKKDESKFYRWLKRKL